jgi:hypothetical protein
VKKGKTQFSVSSDRAVKGKACKKIININKSQCKFICQVITSSAYHQILTNYQRIPFVLQVSIQTLDLNDVFFSKMP